MKFVDTGNWAHSEHLAKIMASKYYVRGQPFRIVKRKTRNLGLIHVIQVLDGHNG